MRVDRGHGKTKFYQGDRVPPVPSGRWGEYTVWQDVRQQDAIRSTREDYALWPASAHLPVLQQRLCEQVPNEEALGIVHNEEKLKELICRRVPSISTALHQVPRDCRVHQHVCKALRKEAGDSEMLNVQPNVLAHIWAEKPYSKTLGRIRAG